MTDARPAMVTEDSNGKPFDETKVEQAAILLVDLHPLLAYDSARRIVTNAHYLAMPSKPARPAMVTDAMRKTVALAIREGLARWDKEDGSPPLTWEEMEAQTPKVAEMYLVMAESALLAMHQAAMNGDVVERVSVALEREFPEFNEGFHNVFGLGRADFIKRLARAAIASLMGNEEKKNG